MLSICFGGWSGSTQQPFGPALRAPCKGLSGSPAAVRSRRSFIIGSAFGVLQCRSQLERRPRVCKGSLHDWNSSRHSNIGQRRTQPRLLYACLRVALRQENREPTIAASCTGQCPELAAALGYTALGIAYGVSLL